MTLFYINLAVMWVSALVLIVSGAGSIWIQNFTHQPHDADSLISVAQIAAVVFALGLLLTLFTNPNSRLW